MNLVLVAVGRGGEDKDQSAGPHQQQRRLPRHLGPQGLEPRGGYHHVPGTVKE